MCRSSIEVPVDGSAGLCQSAAQQEGHCLANATGLPHYAFHMFTLRLMCKENLVGLYSAVGFSMVGPSDVQHGKDPWFEMAFGGWWTSARLGTDKWMLSKY